MNILVPFLLEHPDAAQRLIAAADDSHLPFAAVVDLLGNRADVRFDLDRDIADRLQEETWIGEELVSSYLRVMPGIQWRDRAARAADHDDTGADWVRFVQPPGAEFGLTLPEDAAPWFRVSLFSAARSGVHRVSIDYRQPGPPVGVSSGLTQSCSLPDWGQCNSAECGGGCELVRRHDCNDGLACRCPHG